MIFLCDIKLKIYCIRTPNYTQYKGRIVLYGRVVEMNQITFIS